MKNQRFFYFIDIIIIFFSFLFFVWVKQTNPKTYLSNYAIPFAVFAFIWLTVSLITAKFNFSNKKNLTVVLYSIIRSNIFVLSIIILIIYVFHSLEYSRLIVLGTIALSTLLEMIFGIVLSRTFKQNNCYDTAVKLTFKPTDIAVDDPCYKVIDFPNEPEDQDNSITFNLKDKYLKEKPDVFEFLANHLPLNKLRKDKTLVLDTNTFFNFAYIDPNSQHFFFNLHKVNDYRRINQYFIQINQNLATGGYFVGCAQTNKERYEYFFNTFPKPLAIFLYSFDALWRRVFPKLQGFKQLYFIITKGKNRALSKAEILGRLFFCGFNIIAIKEIDNKLYFIAQKVSEPKADLHPSYGPFIKMKRVGQHGQLINVFKFRTMHPYSEYLQAYIYKENDLEAGGKIKNDFRITSWGKLFRKLWIDELPQFLNLLRGELSLVGVRALSEHYFSLYPKDLQELRVQFKPGLVPPYYADMPNSFEEIIESERKYLLKRQQRPFSTQIQYFFKAWWNIIVKRARSK